MMLLNWLDEKVPKRYLDKLEDVEYQVVSDTKLSKEKLHEVLQILYEYRIID